MAVMLSPETLRRFPLFASLEDDVLKQFAIAGEFCQKRKNLWLFREGNRADSLYLILEGEIMILVPLGSKVIQHVGISKLSEGEIFGWSALVEPYQYQLGAKTDSSCTLAKFNGVKLCEIMTHNPYVGYIMMSRITQVIGERLINLRTQFVSLIEGGQWQNLAGEHAFYQFEGGRRKASK